MKTKSWNSSFCTFVSPSVASCYYDPNTLLKAIFLNTINLWLYLKTRDEIHTFHWLFIVSTLQNSLQLTCIDINLHIKIISTCSTQTEWDLENCFVPHGLYIYVYMYVKWYLMWEMLIIRAHKVCISCMRNGTLFDLYWD